MQALAQLSYASVDSGRGPGGWQVKELVGDLSPAVVEQILYDIPSQLPTPSDAGRFVSRQESELWPRRLLYCCLEGSTVRILIHSAAAGTDRSGRSGNVFSHVVVVDQQAPQAYPISLWRSVDWLTPFGADEVSAATLRNGVFRAPTESLTMCRSSSLVGRSGARECSPCSWISSVQPCGEGLLPWLSWIPLRRPQDG